MGQLGQGTVEYLVVMAIIVIIGLVVTSMAGTFLGTGNNISTTTGRISSITNNSGLSVIESVSDSDGNSLITLKNPSSDTLTITTITPTDSQGNEGTTKTYNQILPYGSKLNFSYPSNSNCVCGTNDKTKNCYYTIRITTPTGLTKTARVTITVDCVNTTSGNSTVDPIEEEPTVTFIEDEEIGNDVPEMGYDDQIDNYPLYRADGTAITTEQDLFDAYTAGEIILKIDGTEISIDQKQSTKLGDFNTYEYFPDTWFSIGSDECGRLTSEGICTAIQNGPYEYNPLKLINAPGYEDWINSIFDEADVLSFCGACDGGCWGPETCSTFSMPAGITMPAGEPGDISDWNFEIYNFYLSNDETSNTITEIGINPITGETNIDEFLPINAAGTVTISYYILAE